MWNRKTNSMKSTIVAMMLVLHGGIKYAVSIPASPFPYSQRQPDGTTVALMMHGDEFSHHESDILGYTVLHGEDGYIYYANETEDGTLVPSEFRVGKVSPGTKGIQKGLKYRLHQNCRGQPCGESHQTTISSPFLSMEGSFATNSGMRKLDQRANDDMEFPISRKQYDQQNHRRTTKTFGTVKNLVVPMRFADHRHRVLPSVEDLDILFNHEGPHELCPTGSVRDVLSENSYGQLTLVSTVVDWIDLRFTEEQIANGNSGLSGNMRIMLREALYNLDSTGFDFGEFDDDEDGMIDAISFIHSGYGAEWGGMDEHGQESGNRIWSHKWKLGWLTNDGVSIGPYHISSALWHTSGTEIGRIGVIAHETGHFLGLPDMYDTDGDGAGLGSWGLMANSWGFDNSQRNPSHLSAWSKLQMGWLTPKEVEYGINYISATEESNPEHPQVIIIGNGKHGFKSGEYLLIENRQQIGFDRMVPRGGLAIYHVDELVENAYQEGYPGQENWPENGNHYKVAMLQADGQYELEKDGDVDGNRGDYGDLFHGNGVNRLGPSTSSEGPFPNTDGYQNGIIYRTNNVIFDISESGRVMSFQFANGDETIPTQRPSDSPTQPPTTTIQPSKPPSLRPSLRPSASPSDMPTEKPSSSSRPSPLPSARPSLRPSASMQPSLFTCRAIGACSGDDQCCSGECQINYEGVGTCKEPKPTKNPSVTPSMEPSETPSLSSVPSLTPTSTPTKSPSSSPSTSPSGMPSEQPSQTPSLSSLPSYMPSTSPSKEPSETPSKIPSSDPSSMPSKRPSTSPSLSLAPSLSSQPSMEPTPCNIDGECTLDIQCCSGKCKVNKKEGIGQCKEPKPTREPSFLPSMAPSTIPSQSLFPSFTPSEVPTISIPPTQEPTKTPSYIPSESPTGVPSETPSHSSIPSSMPSWMPSPAPTLSLAPSETPCIVTGECIEDYQCCSWKCKVDKDLGIGQCKEPKPTWHPSATPSTEPSGAPSLSSIPSLSPTSTPSTSPSSYPSASPSVQPSGQPSQIPSLSSVPSYMPSANPSKEPSKSPSKPPSSNPSSMPSKMPSSLPSKSVVPTLSLQPSMAPSPCSIDGICTLDVQCCSGKCKVDKKEGIGQCKEPKPTKEPSISPSMSPSTTPSLSLVPSVSPSMRPSFVPSTSAIPSYSPSSFPSKQPSKQPSKSPSSTPSISDAPTLSDQPSMGPTPCSIDGECTLDIQCCSEKCKIKGKDGIGYCKEPKPTWHPSMSPSGAPSEAPSLSFTPSDSAMPSNEPTSGPTLFPSSAPQHPSSNPTYSTSPSSHPSLSLFPTSSPQPTIMPTPLCKIEGTCFQDDHCCSGKCKINKKRDGLGECKAPKKV